MRRVVFATVAVIAFAAAVAAQSGRRSTTRSTAPVTPSVPEAKPTEAKPQKAPDLELLVGIDDPSPLSGVPRYYADTVLDVCMQRLTEPAGIAVTAGSRRMTRGDAIKAAKAETRRFVIWLQVGNARADGTRISNSGDEFYVNYLVLEPGSAKVKQSGQVQYSARKVGNVGIGVPTGRGGPAYNDYIVREEARETADRILRAFSIRDSPLPRLVSVAQPFTAGSEE